MMAVVARDSDTSASMSRKIMASTEPYSNSAPASSKLQTGPVRVATKPPSPPRETCLSLPKSYGVDVAGPFCAITLGVFALTGFMP